MFGLKYRKADPTRFVMRFTNGALTSSGAGLSFFYFEPFSTIVEVPIASADLPFVFPEVTRDYQEVTVQGQLTFRVEDPERLSSMLNFSVSSSGAYLSDDPDKLSHRLVNLVQNAARTVVQRLDLRELLRRSEAIPNEVLEQLRSAEALRMHGLEVLALSLISVRPKPDMMRALEAEAREQLSLEADQAIYARRNSAVESERKLKESELNTEIAVEQKRRVIRETKMAADIAVENERAELLARSVENDRLEADSQAYKLESVLKPLRETDWRTLMVAGNGRADPKMAIALAFQGLAENAGRIGQLNMSPELLHSLLGQSND